VEGEIAVQPEVYHRWWPLHIRAACGEVLTDEERSFYEAGLQELEREEIGAATLAQIRQTRARLQALEAERDALLARRQQVEAEIARLESALLAQAGRAHGTGD
jgi:hypothetical protein